MYILITQTEEDFQYFTGIELEEAVVFSVSQKVFKQLIEGLCRIQVHNKKRPDTWKLKRYNQ